jgi:hypothetical protein
MAMATTPAGTTDRGPNGTSTGRARCRRYYSSHSSGISRALEPRGTYGVEPVVQKLISAFLTTGNGSVFNRVY